MEEIIETLGAKKSAYDVRDYKLNVAAAPVFPAEYELPTTIIKNQGSVSSCVAHALSSVVEYFNQIQHNDSTEMSTGYIYGNRRLSLNKGQGMIIRDAIKTLKEYGDISFLDFPYNREVPEAISLYEAEAETNYEKGLPQVISSYYRLSTEDEIKYSLLYNGPVVFSIKWYKDIKVRDGIVISGYPKDSYNGLHCMIIYGWNEQGWKIQNSWGKGWGDSGRAILPYDCPFEEAWGITDTNVDKEHIILKKPFSSFIKKQIAKLINFIVMSFNIIKDKLSKKE